MWNFLFVPYSELLLCRGLHILWEDKHGDMFMTSPSIAFRLFSLRVAFHSGPSSECQLFSSFLLPSEVSHCVGGSKISFAEYFLRASN